MYGKMSDEVSLVHLSTVWVIDWRWRVKSCSMDNIVQSTLSNKQSNLHLMRIKADYLNSNTRNMLFFISSFIATKP